MEKLRETKGITLIALVITIIILLILAGISIATLTGENGILNKASKAKEEHLIEQYKEEINLIIIDEIAERKTKNKNELMIVSLDTKIRGKEWVNEIYKCNSSGEEQSTFEESTHLLVESKEHYEFLIEVNEAKQTARIVSCQKGAGEKYKITYHPNGGEGQEETIEIKQGFSLRLKNCNYTKTGYIFLEWNTQADGTGNRYEQGANVNIGQDITLYAIWQQVEIVAKDIADSNDKSEYYGANVTGYVVQTEDGKDYNEAVKNWKILYANENNIFLIADDYIDADYCPSSSSQTINKYSDYKFTMNNVIKDYTGTTDITDTKIKALNNDYFNIKQYTSDNNNLKAIAYMLDTEIWGDYKGEKAEYAIGGPTIELLMKSYSEKYNVDYKAQASSINGYQISKDGGNSWNNLYEPMLNSEDNLYVIKSNEKAEAMWISSPSAYSNDTILYLRYQGAVSYSNYNSFFDSGLGFRPVICLSTEVKLRKTAEGTYEII